MFFQLIFYLFVILGIFWIINKLSHYRCKLKICLIGKTALITGGSKGLGYETALALASRGCKVIIGCRSNPEEVKQKIIKETNNENIVVMHLDLSCMDSVRNFAAEINKTEERLDILINNAGLSYIENAKLTNDGLNPLMATNYFGHFLLTHLLVDLLKESKNARVVFLTSIFALINNLTVNNLNDLEENTIIGKSAIYANSKFCNIIAAKLFALKLKKYGIVVNSVHPGVIGTELLYQPKVNYFFMVFIVTSILHIFLKNLDEGIQLILKLTIDEENKNNGDFVHDWIWIPLNGIHRFQNDDFCNVIWSKSECLVQLKDQERIK